MVGDILQPTHLLFVLVVALLVLGPKRLPEVARTLGNGLRDFRSAISGESHDDTPRTTLPQDTTPVPAAEPASVVHTPGPEAAPIAEPAAAPTPEPAHSAISEAEPVHQTPVADAAIPEPAPPEHPAGPAGAGASHSDPAPSEASAGAASEHSG